MKQTENYNLYKPEGTDFYDVENSNANMDIIDATLKEHSDGLKEVKENTKIETITYAKYLANKAEYDASGKAFIVPDYPSEKGRAGEIFFDDTKAKTGANDVQGAIENVYNSIFPDYANVNTIYIASEDVTEVAIGDIVEDGFIYCTVAVHSSSGTPFYRLWINNKLSHFNTGATGGYKYLCSPYFPVKKGDVVKVTLTTSTSDGAGTRAVSFIPCRK